MEKKKSIHIDNLYKIKKLDEEYTKAFNRVYDALLESSFSAQEINIVGNIALTQCLEGQANNKKATIVIPRECKDYIRKYRNGSVFKDMKKKICNQDYEKYTISTIWFVFTFSIVLFFLKNLMMQQFLVNYIVDVVVACIAGGFALQNYMIKRRVINRYQFGSFYTRIDVITLIACIFIKIISETNIDITYLMLVIAFFVSKKKIKKQFEEIVS